MSNPIGHIYGCNYCRTRNGGRPGGFIGYSLDGQLVICGHCRPDAAASIRRHGRDHPDVKTRLAYDPPGAGVDIPQPPWFRAAVHQAREDARRRRENAANTEQLMIGDAE